MTDAERESYTGRVPHLEHRPNHYSCVEGERAIARQVVNPKDVQCVARALTVLRRLGKSDLPAHEALTSVRRDFGAQKRGMVDWLHGMLGADGQEPAREYFLPDGRPVEDSGRRLIDALRQRYNEHTAPEYVICARDQRRLHL